MGTWRIEVRSGLAALDDAAADWDALLAAWPGHTLFQTLVWCRTYARQTAADSEVHLLRIREDGVLRGLAPLAVRRFVRAGLTVRRLELLGSGPSDRVSWLLPGGQAEAVAAVVACAVERLPAWDAWDLREFMAEAPGADALVPALRAAGLRTIAAPPGQLATIHIGESWEAFERRMFKADDRARLRQLWRKLERTGRPAIRRVTEAAEVAGLAAALAAFPHRPEGYGRRHVVPFANWRLQPFMAAVTGELARLGWLHMYYLEQDGNPIAYRYDFEYGRDLYCYFSGFDPAYTSCGPGRLLLTDGIRGAFERGLRRVHFLRGSEAYKGAWTDCADGNLQVQAYRRTWRGAALYAARRWQAARVAGTVA